MTGARPVRCPGCRQEMATETLEGNYGRQVDIDLCPGCAAIWFDGLESLALTPGATLHLFALIHERRGEPPPPRPTTLPCPRCGRPLVPTTDAQRATRFNYARCPDDHGRFVGFVDFLREKDFVRPLNPAEVADLRRRVQMVRCASCGAPVDLTKASVCDHCRTPISLLDPHQVETVVAQLRQSEERRHTEDPELPLKLARDRLEVERAFARFDPKSLFDDSDAARGLAGAGVDALVRLLLGRG